jgi:hypothetical protein
MPPEFSASFRAKNTSPVYSQNDLLTDLQAAVDTAQANKLLERSGGIKSPMCGAIG